MPRQLLNAVEVWSTLEGRQRFDSHVDKLMNYLRYWQASVESEKTSIRTKTQLSGMRTRQKRLLKSWVRA